jgi:hypothetical protein
MQAMNSPQSQRLTVGAMVVQYSIVESINRLQPVTRLIFLVMLMMSSYFAFKDSFSVGLNVARAS